MSLYLVSEALARFWTGIPISIASSSVSSGYLELEYLCV